MAKGLGWEIAFILFFIPSILSAEAINITAVGGWHRTIREADLQSGAGSGLNSTYESTPDATSLILRQVKKPNGLYT